MFNKSMKTLLTCELFKGMNSAELISVLTCLNPKVYSYKRSELVAMEGDQLTGLGIVLAGDVVITRENAVGSRIIIATNGPGGMFGEIAAFAGNYIWSDTIIAREACKVMFLPGEKIVGSCENACVSHKLMIANILKIISLKALMLNKKIDYLVIKSMRGKVCAYLLEQFKKQGKQTFVMPLKRNELADFLNVSRPSLSREMGKLRDEGVIEFHRASIKIKDLNTLKTLAE
ncbi:MAG: Crp/Fnr family transcriptional regulator [Eubacteriales bacterium]|jgi:CRP-like cAMP-binding protein